MSTVFWSFGEMGPPTHTPLFSFLFFRMITIGWYQDYHFRESSRKTYKGKQDPEYHSWLSRGMVLISKPSSQEPLTRSLLHYSEKNSCLSFPTWKVEIIWQLLESCKNTMKIYQKFLAQYTLCKEKKFQLLAAPDLVIIGKCYLFHKVMKIQWKHMKVSNSVSDISRA